MSLSPDVEDRLCQALVGRGLITRDEFELVRSGGSGDNRRDALVPASSSPPAT